jgi:tripartite-type tricarboxylate transporter receptor subunit TctC
MGAQWSFRRSVMAAKSVQRRRRGLLLAPLLCLVRTNVAARPEPYPAKPIHWIVPYPPGGGADLLARLITERLAQTLKQAIVIKNLPGDSTTLATLALLTAPRDGYTVLQTAEQLAVNAVMLPHLEYSAERDIEFIAPLVRTPLVLLARPTLPASNAADLVTLMREPRQRLAYGSWGTGGMNHLAMAAFTDRFGVHPRHIPYRGAGPAVQGLLNGDIDLYFSDLTTAVPYIRSGRLKALLVSSLERQPCLPDVPTADESGAKGFDMVTWQGLVGAAGMPSSAVLGLSTAVRDVLQDPTLAKQLQESHFQISPAKPEQFREDFLRTKNKLGALARRLNIHI